jgi:hypothetical protein
VQSKDGEARVVEVEIFRGKKVEYDAMKQEFRVWEGNKKIFAASTQNEIELRIAFNEDLLFVLNEFLLLREGRNQYIGSAWHLKIKSMLEWLIGETTK